MNMGQRAVRLVAKPDSPSRFTSRCARTAAFEQSRKVSYAAVSNRSGLMQEQLMATAKKTRVTKLATRPAMKAKKADRCWTGYEPTPGKKPFSKGSCKPKEK